MRKFSSNYVKNEQKEDLMINGPSTNVPDRKKYGTNLYNPPIHTHHDREKTESSQGEMSYANKNPKLHINKKPVPKKEDLSNPKNSTNHGIKSKSVAKGKASKMGK